MAGVEVAEGEAWYLRLGLGFRFRLCHSDFDFIAAASGGKGWVVVLNDSGAACIGLGGCDIGVS